MKVDANISADMSKVGDQVKHLESLGYDGVKIAELNHDPFLPLAVAADHSNRVELLTSVAVAFARNPMSMATIAHDLNAFSRGRMAVSYTHLTLPTILRV